jgi:hypothetical protein
MHILLFIATIWLVARFPLGILTGRFIRDAKGGEDAGERGEVSPVCVQHGGIR